MRMVARCSVALCFALAAAGDSNASIRGQQNLQLIKEHFAHLDHDLVLLPWFQQYVADDAVFRYCPNSIKEGRYPNCVNAVGKKAYLEYVTHNLYSKHAYFLHTVQTPSVFMISEDGNQIAAKFDVNGELAGKPLPGWEMEMMVWKFNGEGQISETDFFTDTLFWNSYLKQAEKEKHAASLHLGAIYIANHGLYPPMGSTLTFGQYTVYWNTLSVGIFCFASMTVFIYSQLHAVSSAYKTAVVVAGLAPFISAIEFCMSLYSFNMAVAVQVHDGGYEVTTTGQPYLHDWLFADLTSMPISLIGLVLVLHVGVKETLSLCGSLAAATVGMLLFAFYGDTNTLSLMVGIALFAFIAFMLVSGLEKHTSRQPMEAQGAVRFLRWFILVSWAAYPFIAVLPMMGFGGPLTWKVMQIGYAVCDICIKGVVACLTWVVAARKTEVDQKAALLPPL